MTWQLLQIRNGSINIAKQMTVAIILAKGDHRLERS